MPFQSEAQRRFLYAKHPEIAKRWSMEEKNMEHGKHMMPVKDMKGMAGIGKDKKEMRKKAVKRALKKKK